MALGAETGFPAPAEERIKHPAKVAMINAEVNDRCAYSRHCERKCILNQLGSGTKPELATEEWQDFVDEACTYGATIENLALVGKEPTETPARLEYALERYHSQDHASRPLRIGMITAGHNLRSVRALLEEHPLDWVLTSLDAPETGLRTPAHPSRALRAAVDLKSAGCFRELGINSVMEPRNLRGLTGIGNLVMNETSVDHWSLTPMLQLTGGRLKSTISFSAQEELISRLIHQFGDYGKPILFNLGLAELIRFSGGMENLETSMDFWRVEYRVPNTNAKLVSMNPRNGFFLRLRYDGQLVDRSEFHGETAAGTRFGSYHRGALSAALDQMSSERLAGSTMGVVS